MLGNHSGNHISDLKEEAENQNQKSPNTPTIPWQNKVNKILNKKI